MIMFKCRLCLKNSKNMKCIFDVDNNKGRSYAEMINSVASVKVSPGDGMTDQICLCCRRKTKEFWDFKLQVERSYTALQENSPIKRVCFTNICDVEITKKVTEEDSQRSIPLNFTNDLINNNDEPFNYNDTVIKRISNDEKRPLTVIDFLNSIKKENENDYQNDYEHEVEYDYDPDVADPDYQENQPPKKSKKKNNENKKDQTILGKPLKLVFLPDYKLMPTRKPRKLKTIKDKLRICPYCGIMTKTLKVHLASHSDERPYKCDMCSKSFAWENSLKFHMKEVHGDKVHKCDQCAATFSSLVRLKSHIKSRHSAEKKHICNVCSKAFKLKYHVFRHMESVHKLGPKKFKCVMCHDSFSTSAHLRHHLRVHTGERPYNCEICSQPYSYKHDFNRHCLKKHGVWFYRRSVPVMNEQVLVEERILMRDLMLRYNGILKDDKPVNPFEGPRGVLAFEQMIKAIESGKIVVDLQL